MYKYRINKKEFNKSKTMLSVGNFEIIDFVDKIEDYDNYNDDRLLVSCECDNIDILNEGETIEVTNDLFLNYSVSENVQQEICTFNNSYQLYALNKSEKTFSFFIDKKYTLDIEKITNLRVGEENPTITTEQNIFIYCNGKHYFDINDDITLYFTYINDNGIYTTVDIEFSFFNDTILTTSYEKFDAYLFKLFFEENLPTSYEEREEKEGNLKGCQVLRDNFLFTEKTDTTFWSNKSTVSIDIPFSSSFETNLYQMDLIKEKFVDKTKKETINRIVDLERDVYYPSVYIYNDKYEYSHDIYTIKFNLHFREHRGDDWTVTNDSLWNGVDDNYRIIKDITDDNVSDLLMFLGFNNEDVRYQRNKLKKSFLRLSYYDSPNPANQNLLMYSTIFVNSGELFSKYARYGEEEGYTLISFDEEEGKYVLSPDKKGIGVDKEYDGFIEEKRLSSQFVVKDKNTSKSSSEGFYLYLWKEDETPIPQDIYMKVEFNHAEFGRTIPFMMPYGEKSDGEETIKSIKSFQDIVNDFTTSKKPYTMSDYLKYSYIHLKYAYDVENQKHRYFIDPQTYGTQVSQDNELIINLYEAKIGEGEADENNTIQSTD